MKKTFTLALFTVLFSFASKAQLINEVPAKPTIAGYANTIWAVPETQDKAQKAKGTIQIAYTYIIKPSKMDLMADTTLKDKIVLFMMVNNKKETFIYTRSKSNKENSFYENTSYGVKISMPNKGEKQYEGTMFLYNGNTLLETKSIIYSK